MAMIHSAKAQLSALQVADSVSTDLYNAGNWKQLIAYGNQSIATGVDFTGLRLRVAYANFITGDYKHALKQYNKVLAKDPYNITARYYAYYCNKYLADDLHATYNLSYLDKETLHKDGINTPIFTDINAETGIKQNDDINRNNAFYSRVGIGNRIGWRLQLEQSAAYFDQGIFKLYDVTDRRRTTTTTLHLADQQKEYYAKLSFAVNQNMAIIGSYHYLNTKFDNITYNSNLGLIGLKYTGTYIDAQADVNFGRLDAEPLEQYNAKLTYYPFGNFNLYTISRASVKELNSDRNFIFDQTIGFKLIKNTWLESSVALGNLDDYLDADGLYVYNGIDNTTFKCGEAAYYQLNNNVQLQLNYFYERKSDAYQSLKYDQNSVTVGIVWKF
ncbi:hypothetical protein SAMN05216490_3096 [Mucilaginibacter mallensis]|uniref:Uncharacterized protein n=2 Tax=Mucilaginibacter mallensis TaxID=652787 RepID=A0A1H1ZG43_MUCMA|nr:hypothetical protein SAMN05216490_3096 [Mucilaginibacter mallensis]